jgi:hypothetical protein
LETKLENAVLWKNKMNKFIEPTIRPSSLLSYWMGRLSHCFTPESKLEYWKHGAGVKQCHRRR